jgi:2-oxoglutarate dehydrogenase E2 component (dihydrolipoamide succinyltransferase)
MIVDIVMPKMGESIMEGTIIKWYKKVGEHVKKDETIFEISTDKVDTEVPSSAEGVLTEILFKETDTVEVGVAVARIETEKESVVIKEVEPVLLGKNEVISTVAVEEKQTGELIDIPMPKMGESVMEGTIIKWYKKAGDAVKKDDTLFEISTDKVDTEVPSPADGFLVEIIVKEQETVAVGVVVARLSSSDKVTLPVVKKEVVEEVSMHSQIAAAVETVASIETEEPAKSEFKTGKTRFLSPLVLNIAQIEGISIEELESIKGTGLDGRISKKDVFEYIDRKKNLPPQKKEQVKEIKPVQSPSFEIPKFDGNLVAGKVERIPMDNIRQKIMQHMVNSRDTSVHVTALIEVDMTNIYRFIQTNKESFLKKEGVKLTYMPFISQACVKALKQFPLVNATIDGSSILVKKYVNLGIAVSVEPNGLIVPNIKNAHEKNIIGLASSISELAEKARTKKLTPDDISGGTFTITNYGVFGTLFGTPIINQPEVAILGVGAVVKKPVVVEMNGFDTIAIKPIMYLTMAHDHRLIDGMLGGKFLAHIKDTLEKFDGNVL